MNEALTNLDTLTKVLQRSYAMYGKRLAVRDGEATLTYDELKDRALLIAAHLRSRGVKPGDRVLLVLQNCSEYLQLEHALILAGFVRICAIPRLHASEVLQQSLDALPAIAFIDSHWLNEADPALLQQMPCPIVRVGGMPETATAALRTTEAFENFLKPTDASKSFADSQPEDLVWFMYTSGSTGKPKGVMHTQKSISNMIIKALAAMVSARPEDVALHTAPLSHFSGVIAHVISAAGGANVVMDRFSPELLFDAVSTYGITVLPVVPTQLNMLTDYLRSTPRDTSGVRIVPYAGSAIAPDRLAAARQFFGNGLIQYYGSSEVPLPVTVLAPEDHTDTINELGLPRFASAGRPPVGVDVKIVDSKDNALPTGSTGEILVRSATASRGYWQNDAASREILDPEGFIRTGDVGVIDKEGFLFIVDRSKDMIVTGGFNVYPREVENTISTLAGVREVAVVSAPDEKWGEAIVAVVAPQPNVELTLEQVQAHCRAHLAGYKLPRRLMIVDTLSKSSTGKVQKKIYAQELWGDRQRRIGG